MRRRYWLAFWRSAAASPRPGEAPAWFNERAGRGRRRLSRACATCPRTTTANTNAAYWAAVEAELIAARQEAEEQSALRARAAAETPTSSSKKRARSWKRRAKRIRNDRSGAMSTSDFHKIRRLPPYVFEEVNRLKARLRGQGVDIIDFGMGNPDLPVPQHIVEKLCETARQAAHQPLLRFARHSGSAQGDGRLLRAPLRREAQSGHADRLDARLEGRLRQSGAGDHGAGRRDHFAEPVLPDPRVRLHHGGRRHSFDRSAFAGAVSCAASAAPCATRCRRRSRW